MEKIAYMIHVGEINDLVELCVETFMKNTDKEKIYFYTIRAQAPGIENLQKYDRLEIRELDPNLWNNRMMAHKIENIRNFYRSLKEGTRVLVLDTDLIFKNNPFDMFEEGEANIYYTSRYYKYHFPINAGVWGFIKTKNTDLFLLDYIKQINNPTWDKLLKFRKKHNRTSCKNWWVDQDYLCVVNNNLKEIESKFSVKIFDVGSKYNFCPSTDIMGIDKSVHHIKAALKNDDIKIIHFKSNLKYLINLEDLKCELSK